MTTTVAKAKTSAAGAKSAAEVQVPGISRREFLYYAWGGSMALLLAQTTGILIWFGLPRFRAGEFGGEFTVTDIPQLGTAPGNFPQGKFWLSNTDEGIVALYKVCTHLGCLYKWVDANDRFECPCHGSKYERDGTYIEGPAPRSLDRFAITVNTKGGTFTNNPLGDPVNVQGAQIDSVLVDTGTTIKRAGRV